MLEEKRILMIIISALPVAYAPSYFSVLHKCVLIFCACRNKGFSSQPRN